MIIKCPECGREISDKAASCPGCGCPRDVWAGETKGERIVPSRAGPTPACGLVRNDKTEERRAVERPRATCGPRSPQRGGVGPYKEKTAFPFIVSRFDGSHVTCVCQKCGTAVEYSRTDVQLPGWKVYFPRGLKCPDCGNEIENGSYYMTANPWQQSGGELLPVEGTGERIATPSCGTVRNDMAVREAGPYGGGGRSGRKCPKCGGHMTVQAVSESRKGGCGMVLLYILLALTVIGILVIIPLALRKKTVTRTYAVCQLCGNKILLSED